MARDTGKHSGADFLAIVKSEDIVGPTGSPIPYANRSASLFASRFGAGLPIRPSPYGRPTRSCRHREDLGDLRHRFAMLRLIGQNPENECFGPSNCFGFGLAVRHGARQTRYLGNPAPVTLLVDFHFHCLRVIESLLRASGFCTGQFLSRSNQRQQPTLRFVTIRARHVPRQTIARHSRVG
jgi:hypothetical protein